MVLTFLYDYKISYKVLYAELKALIYLFPIEDTNGITVTAKEYEMIFIFYPCPEKMYIYHFFLISKS